MSGVIDSLERDQLRKIPAFAAGDRVKVHFQVVEGNRRRTQVFEGIVLKRQGKGSRETFTVRKQSFGVGVERTFPLHSPKVERIEIAARGDVRRAKLYYLRDRVGRSARVSERRGAAEEPLEQEFAGGLDSEGVPAEEAPAEAAPTPEAEEAEAEEAEGEEAEGEEAEGTEPAEPGTEGDQPQAEAEAPAEPEADEQS